MTKPSELERLIAEQDADRVAAQKGKAGLGRSKIRVQRKADRRRDDEQTKDHLADTRYSTEDATLADVQGKRNRPPKLSTGLKRQSRPGGSWAIIEDAPASTEIQCAARLVPALLNSHIFRSCFAAELNKSVSEGFRRMFGVRPEQGWILLLLELLAHAYLQTRDVGADPEGDAPRLDAQHILYRLRREWPGRLPDWVCEPVVGWLLARFTWGRGGSADRKLSPIRVKGLLSHPAKLSAAVQADAKRLKNSRARASLLQTAAKIPAK
jgi:hypothetical protein